MNNVNKKFSTTKLVAGLLACTITAGTAAALGSGLSVFAGTADDSGISPQAVIDEVDGEYEYTYNRSGDYIIDDTGPMDQSYDTYPWDLFPTYTQLINSGFRYVTFTVEMKMKEKNDGYQQIYLYPSKGGSYTDYKQRIQIEYGGEGIKSDFTTVSIQFKSVSLSDYLNNNELCTVVRYGATGGGEDTWYNRDAKITAQVTREVIRSYNTAMGDIKIDNGYNNP